jgi:gamma-glutamyltranspeptidase/glutathione hydrolase
MSERIMQTLSSRLVYGAVLAVITAGCGGATQLPEAEVALQPVVSRSPVRAEHGMVVSTERRASQIGRAVLRAGGNAVDAAIATGFALAVTHPAAGNVGGGGFMVIRFPDGEATAIDFREKAPLAAHPEMFLDENGEYSSSIHHNSHLAVGVPGTVAGFAKAHERYGTLPWERLVEPAVDLAKEGFVLPQNLARSLAAVVERYQQYPATVAAFSKAGEPYAAGETMRQPDLAGTLRRIMHHGRDGFYRGETARLVAAEMRRGRGLITEEDLARYEAKERQPIRGTYRGYDILSMPPPSSGGVALVEMLNILEGYDLRAMDRNSAEYVHYVTEAMRRAYRDRALLLADVDMVDVPVERLTSKAHAADLRETIEESHATISAPSDIAQPYESPETTHYSVVDEDGMAVAVTYTLEAGYGSKIVVSGGGFLLNNEMGDFNPKLGLTTAEGLIGSDANLARPEQRMLSSMTPTILVRNGDLVAVTGSPGGRTIINSVLHVVLNIVDFGMGIQEAVDAHRFHHQWLPDEVRVEGGAISAATLEQLQGMGQLHHDRPAHRSPPRRSGPAGFGGGGGGALAPPRPGVSLVAALSPTALTAATLPPHPVSERQYRAF